MKQHRTMEMLRWSCGCGEKFQPKPEMHLLFMFLFFYTQRIHRRQKKITRRCSVLIRSAGLVMRF
ncbi:hypothetical protein HanPSC8_Chr16g0708041 [Helianthus annuus]|nr:hypothetical protein HanPSC8_Chr16g0708041 [Helianthus annuus]